MGFFTARNRQPNPFAERKRREREQREAEQETAAILADPEAMEAIAEAEAETSLVAVPVDRNPDSAEYTQAPDISTYEPQPEMIPLPTISPETQAKIDAIVNHAIPPVLGPVAIEQPEPEPAPAEADTKRGRGRPRPQETIERDNAVHALLVGADTDTGISKESIAAELDEKEQQVYSSLRQLSKEGRAETRYVKPHGYRWFAV